ncbi:MAG: N-formylglutamate amidohydrolase [Rhodobacteraceae bacterium]|nr:N-formylglutamate amidohydrolase [Paracoccaceae bacterium]
MTAPNAPTLLGPDDGPACELVNPAGASPVVLVCEHASNFIPASLNGLGMAAEDRQSHAAWDIGAEELSQQLSVLLDAPLVAGRVSRLVHDCNRPAGGAGAFPAQSEAIAVPGNLDLDDDAQALRARDIHQPFHTMLEDLLAARAAPVVLVTLHSFTPIYHGMQREVELGLLHSSDDRLARMMLRQARALSPLRSALNAPYGPADGVLYTLERHAVPAGHLNVMVEFRNDLLLDAGGCGAMATLLADLLRVSLPALGVALDGALDGAPVPAGPAS